ncbi:carboxypeptidase-like regulatory domain-containing protein [Tamlana sp. 2201CG12-4]|uniref:carboxypeptidase-like regulatory domain-containing protein n=1 Tax=Tamlana sp. 2201CG12-4 TaxID=3112582 RepID=UPI002DB92455|nr:carboxypeptidase-like regulatory domain-containing protein [Tamlana sp. 2201CG12-4]MEC3908714.1 carboxypeptidase-like regulatory domain-containing protein [Tamlana sp. 2201CG12-4]
MRKVININIPEPCHENWNDMTPEEKGRHCAVCQKTVFDFTTKTDEYIVKTFTENDNVCGRFKSTQLKRDLVLNRKEKNSYLSLIVSGVLALIGISNHTVFSQEKPSTFQVDSIKQNNIKGKITPQSQLDSRLIKGIVLDESKTPLPGASISIESSSEGTVSDFDGNFSIEVKKGAILYISYVGYESQKVKITESLNEIIMVELDESVLGGIVVVGGAISNDNMPYISEEARERKKQRTFARKNAATFYKQKRKDDRLKVKSGMVERTKAGKFLHNITNVFRKKTN